MRNFPRNDERTSPARKRTIPLSAACFLLLSAGPIASQETGGAKVPGDPARILLEAISPSAWDADETIESCAAALQGPLGASPLAEILVERLQRLAGEPGVPPTIWKRLERLVANPKLHGLARLRGRLALFARRLETGREAGPDPLDAYLSSGLAIGPFGGEGSLWHGVVFPPEERLPAIGEEVRGRFGPVSWRPVRRPTGKRGFDLAPPYPEYRRKGCQYGLFQLRSGKARGAWLEVRCAGSFEAWWNGKRIASVNRSLEPSGLRRFLPIFLLRGWNRLLFKTAHAETSTLALRIVDARGETVAGLEEEGARKIHPLEGKGDEIFDLPFEDALAAASRLGDGLAARALRGRLLQRAGKRDEGLAGIEKAFEEDPKDPTLRSTLISALRGARYLPADVVRVRIDRLLELPEETVLGHVRLFLQKIRRLRNDDKEEKALALCEKALAAHPKHPLLLKTKQDIFEDLSWSGEAVRVRAERFRTFPHHPAIVLLEASRLENEEETSRALALVESELANLPGNRSLIARALSLSRSLGDSDRIEKWLAKLHERNPKSRKARLDRAERLEDRGLPAEAVAEIEKIEGHDRDPSLQKRIGDLHLKAGAEAEAIKHYRRSLELAPDQHYLRFLVQRLSGLEPFPECRPFRLDALAEAAAWKARAEDSAAPSTLVLDQMVIRVYEDGSRMEETHQLRRINDRNGVEAHEEASEAARADDLLELRTILPNGEIYLPHRVSGGFSMPKLEPGAFIEQRFRNYVPAPDPGPMGFPQFFFQGSDEPFRFSRLVVLLPKGVRIGSFTLHHFPEEGHSVQEVGDLVAHVFLRRDMPRLEQEALMPPMRELVPWVEFTRDRDREAFVRARRLSFLASTRPLLEIREKAAALCRGRSTDLDKARAIHEFTQAHTPDADMRPGSPQPISVLLKGEGDRFLLELSLLRAAGIPWTPALIHPLPPDMDDEPEPRNEPERFWRVGAALVRPKGAPPYWLIQGAPRWSPLGRLPTLVAGNPLDRCPVLLLEGDAGLPLRMPGIDPRDLARNRITADLRLENGDGILKARIDFPGDSGFRLAEFLRSTNENVRRLIARRVAGSTFRGFSIRKVSFPGLERKGVPASILLELRRPRLLEKTPSGYRLPAVLPPLRLLRVFGGRARRTHPLVWKSPNISDLQLRIHPGNLRFPKAPKGLLLRRLVLDYGFSTELLRDGSLRIRRFASVLPGRIPHSRYGEFLELCRKVDELENRALELEGN